MASDEGPQTEGREFVKLKGIRHWVILNKSGKPWLPSMAECHKVELRPDDVVVDIGAYCGTFALIAARTAKRVIAYEPSPFSYETIMMNELPSNLEVRQRAVVGAGAPDSVRFHISTGIGVTNSIVRKPARATAETIRVEAVPYDIAVRGATVVKVDVEGAEYDYDLVQPGIRALIVEFHKVPGMAFPAVPKTIIEQIEDAGFRPLMSPSWESGWNRSGAWVR